MLLIQSTLTSSGVLVAEGFLLPVVVEVVEVVGKDVVEVAGPGVEGKDVVEVAG